MQSGGRISIAAKNYTRAALAQMAKVEVLSKIDKQEWYKNTIYYQKHTARESNPVDLANELFMRRARLESLRSKITSQSSDERISDRSARNTKFETGETPYIGIGPTEIHPSPNFPRVGSSFCSHADEIELESGQISEDATSFRVFLHDFLDRSEAASRTSHYICTEYALMYVSKDGIPPERAPDVRKKTLMTKHLNGASKHGDKLFPQIWYICTICV